MSKKTTKALISSLSDYAFTIIECKKELVEYAQLVDDQAEEINELKSKIEKLESEK